MNPRLLSMNSTSENQLFSLKDIDVFKIGRSVKNHLTISDNGLSREHAVLINTAEGFYLQDLKSRNGTFVNETAVDKILLKHGDRIRLGKNLFRFLTDEIDEQMLFSNEVLFDEDLMLTVADCYPRLEKSGGEMSAELDVLTKIGAAIADTESSEDLQKKFLSIILDFIPASRGAIILLDEDLTSPNSVCVLDKSGNSSEPIHISRSITQTVLREKNAIIANDIAQTNFQAAESLLVNGINSVLCVPLMLGEISGLIYLDSRELAFKFENDNLQQMTAIANLIAAAMKNIRHLESLRLENESLQSRAKIETDMIGESDSMKQLSQFIGKVAPTDATVLIYGESGTGKELVARAVHKNSQRQDKPFIALNCAILNENLLESDLFGHEKGSFTGATIQRKGKIEIADGGTLFLDEIGELALPLQAKLLRVLQEREFERVGGTKPIKANVRLIAATNRDLAEEVNKGRFREDLFFRLNVVQMQVPPLRQRRTDIPLLAEHFIGKYSDLCKRRISGISRSALQILINHNWRGNVRELENAIERAVVLGSTDIIQPEDLPGEIVENSNFGESTSALDLNQQIRAAKCKIILTALSESDGSYTEAARRLAIHPNNLHRLIRDLGIKDDVKNAG